MNTHVIKIDCDLQEARCKFAAAMYFIDNGPHGKCSCCLIQLVCISTIKVNVSLAIRVNYNNLLERARIAFNLHVVSVCGWLFLSFFTFVLKSCTICCRDDLTVYFFFQCECIWSDSATWPTKQTNNQPIARRKMKCVRVCVWKCGRQSMQAV